MRTAEEILDSFLPLNMGARECVLAAINEARKEAILECAGMVTDYFDFEINKTEILSLIKELK